MTAHEQDARRDFVDRMGDLGAASGMPRMAARLLAHLLTVDAARATAAELAEGLEASPAAISGAVRFLEQVGLLHRTRERGSRRDVFVIDEGTWAAYMTKGLDVVRVWGAVFAEGAASLGEGRARTRLADNAELFAFLGAELDDAMARWHAGDRTPRRAPGRPARG